MDKPVMNQLSTAGVCASIGLQRISLVRASGETVKYFFDDLGGNRVACPLSRQCCLRLLLPEPAPQTAVRPDTTQPFFDSTR